MRSSRKGHLLIKKLFPSSTLCRTSALIAAFLLCLPVQPLLGAPQDPPAPKHPLLGHLQRTLTGDDSQWRTPNPDYREDGQGPSEFGLRFRMEPDGRHATGELTGRFEDGPEVTYWSLFAFYNPVTEKVIAQQIGWDGTLVRGEVPVQPGERQTIDMTMYGASGAMKRTRHQMHFIDADTHTADAYEYGPNGEWKLERRWRWRRYQTPGATGGVRTAPAATTTPAIAPHVAHLLSGSGRWRAANPEYEPGGKAPKQYGMNYRWGPHKQHVIAEIVSLHADGRQEKDWSLYITHNPVTGITALEQTGRSGVYFRGEMSTDADGHHVENGLVHIPNGTVKSVRDRNVMLDPNTRVANVYERDENGRWRKAREWTWRQE